MLAKHSPVITWDKGVMGGGIPGIFTLNNSSVVFLSKLIPGDFFLIPVVQGLMDLEKRRLKGGNLTPVYIRTFICA